MAATTHLGSLQALELAIRTGSLKAAADALNITPAAVGQRIKLLEDYLGMDLLVRGRSGIRPTPELEAALAHLSAAFRELDTTVRLLDFQRVLELHIVADSDWADLWLAPRLPRFREANRNIRFCINGVGDVPMRLGQADCEVWFGPPRAPGSDDELFHDYVVPVSAPENVARIMATPEHQRLDGVPLLHLESYGADPAGLTWPDWIARFGHRAEAPARGIRYHNLAAAKESLFFGAGFALCGLSLVAPALDMDLLALPLPLSEGAWTEHAYRISFRGSALRRTQTAAFRDWLFAEARSTSADLSARIAA